MEARATTLRSTSAQEAPRWLSAAATLALAGATIGTGLDAIHVHTGTTAYAQPVLFGQAWWVPPLFASAALAIGLGRPLVERMLGVHGSRADRLGDGRGHGRSSSWPMRRAVSSAVVRLRARSCWPRCSCSRWLLWDRTGLGLVLAVLTAIVGTLVEITLVRTGTFLYREPSLAGVAVWLPWLYGCAAVGVGNFGKRLVDG